MIALVPERRDKRGRRIGHNWWREFITAEFYAADHAWWLERERVAMGYETEKLEFAASHPRPTLKGFMLAHLASTPRERRLPDERASVLRTGDVLFVRGFLHPVRNHLNSAT